MIKVIENLFQELEKNNKNYIVFYKKNNRFVKTFSEFIIDVDNCARKLFALEKLFPINTVGIIGSTSYDWMVIDWACLKVGYKTVAFLETFTSDEIITEIKNNNCDILLADFALLKQCASVNDRVYYFDCQSNIEKQSFDSIKINQDNKIPMRIRKNYGITFTSGTSAKIKKVELYLIDKKRTKKNIKKVLNNIIQYIKYINSFWSKKNNRIIIFMPFSHVQQRTFVQAAFFRKINIIISDPINCLKHIIKEKPNIIISVPVFYEVIAGRVKMKINQFSKFKSFLFGLFNKLKINTYSNKNIIKRIFNIILFNGIKRLYGGRADYFITGSAPINKEVLRTFYSIGVKILEGYGQSETGFISMNNDRNFKIGSVGKPMMKVKISEESEILVKYDKEIHEINKDLLSIQNGYIHTGDLGYIDEQGYLFLTGRKDDIIVLQNGKKIHPLKIENEITKHNGINNAIIYSDNGKQLEAIVSGILSCKLLITLIEKINSESEDYEQIKSFVLTPELFSVEEGTLTPTFKIKRGAIVRKFKNEEKTKIA